MLDLRSADPRTINNNATSGSVANFATRMVGNIGAPLEEGVYGTLNSNAHVGGDVRPGRSLPVPLPGYV